MKVIIKFIIYLFISLLSVDCNYNLSTNVIKQDYFFLLNIPKINLEAKVYDFYNENNNVDKGIFLVKEYDFTTLKGSLILASHSGNSSISYFKNLYLLSTGDLVLINYSGNIYYYEIVKVYKINKNGKFKYQDFNKGIYLITCDKNNDKKQLVFQGKMVKSTKKSNFL